MNACVGIELRESDARINALYQDMIRSRDRAEQLELRQQQRAWIAERDRSCELNTRESDRERWYAALLADPIKTVCVVGYTRDRIAQLEALQKRQTQSAAGAETGVTRPSAAVEMATTLRAPDGKPRLPTRHTDGKWYFEVVLDRARILQVRPEVIIAGFTDSESQMTAAMWNIRPSDVGTVIIGCAIDLDAGMAYFRENGSWNDKEPGSNLGIAVKLGREYQAQVRSSGRMDALIANGGVVPNYGDTPFSHPVPEGYRGWRQ